MLKQLLARTTDQQQYAVSAVCFFLSAFITGWFIVEGKDQYNTNRLMLLSGAIAAVKWLLQIAAALLFLYGRRASFLAGIGMVCLLGAIVLLPYCFSALIQSFSSSFFLSLLCSVAVMIFCYNSVIIQTSVGKKWLLSWLGTLMLAIWLQLTLVFHLL